MLIYVITNKITGKLYVGQTIRSLKKRWSQHKAQSKKDKPKSLIAKAMKKYGIENFEIEQIARIVCDNKDESCGWLNLLEPLYIKYYNTIAPNGYNLDSGGKNKVMHEETKIKIGTITKGNQVWRGRKHTDESKAKMSEIMKGNQRMLGKSHSEETKQKMSKSAKGKSKSLEAKQNMSNAKKGNTSGRGNKGKKASLETRMKIVKALTGRICKKVTKEKIRKANKGKKRTDESKKKMSESAKKAWDRRKNSNE